MKKSVSKKPAAAKAPTAGTTITFKLAREKTGPKTELLKLIPREGSITVKALTEKAAAKDFNVEQVPKLVGSLARYGYVTLA
jgi:hypothetical protein